MGKFGRIASRPHPWRSLEDWRFLTALNSGSRMASQGASSTMAMRRRLRQGPFGAEHGDETASIVGGLRHLIRHHFVAADPLRHRPSGY